VRKRGVLLIISGATLVGIGTLAFLAQGSPTEPPPPPTVVAKVADVSITPRAVEVVIRRGADRVLQREGTDLRCSAGMMGCPGAIELRPVTLFLVRDEVGALHAFIGEDPRNGCALEWMPLPLENNNWFIDGVRVDAVFHDVCHGSLYDRRGRRVGGPSPFDLNALATEERGSDLYVDSAKVLVGSCPGCPR
jgi:hypothetical protein